MFAPKFRRSQLHTCRYYTRNTNVSTRYVESQEHTDSLKYLSETTIDSQYTLSHIIGSWPCLDSHLGNVTMEIHAPKDMVYMSAIDYFIQIWK